MARKHKKVLGEDAGVIGIFRIHLMENGKIVGDSGWVKNNITNVGARDFLVENLTGSGNSKRVSYMGIGTGTTLASNDTSLGGELSTNTNRPSVSTSVDSSRTAQFTAQFASSVFSTRGGASNISNLGLFASQSGGTVFAGNTYASSSWATNQDVNATYQIRFPFA